MYLDIGLCPEALRADRTIGDKSALCPAASTLGRITFGLYGGAAPSTAANFAKLVATGAYTGTTFHKVQAGKWVKAGKQGSKRYGEVDSRAVDIARNADVVRRLPEASAAFASAPSSRKALRDPSTANTWQPAANNVLRFDHVQHKK